MGIKQTAPSLKYVLDVMKANTKIILDLTIKNAELHRESIKLKDVIERWIKLGIEQNEQQTVFWDDDIINLLKYIRGEEIDGNKN
ncbi:MAG: hypothetical protein QQN63_03640 [Nitrosopumilus sp.]